MPGEPTYVAQLRAFRDAVLLGTPCLTDAEDAVRNMEVIDAIYRAAGLPMRAPFGEGKVALSASALEPAP
jgi:predicted dehydrogenase